jgi:hypothetical protein
MELKTFIKKFKVNKQELAIQAGTTPKYLERIIYKSAFPSRKLAARIEAATEGAVRKEDLIFPIDY